MLFFAYLFHMPERMVVAELADPCGTLDRETIFCMQTVMLFFFFFPQLIFFTKVYLTWKRIIWVYAPQESFAWSSE